MGQKRPIETDLPMPDYEAFIAMAEQEGMSVDELFGVMIREGLDQTRVQTMDAVVLILPSEKQP